MKKIAKLLFVAALAAAAFSACQKPNAKDNDNTTPEAVAPIIANVVMPTEANAIPGKDATIQGVGFMEGDVIECIGKDGQPNFKPTVKSVTKTGITIAIPETATGAYTVTVTRNGKTATLDGELKVAKVEKIENIVLPTGVVHWGEKVTITADGIKATDKIILESDNYADVEIEGAASENKVEFEPAVTLYGENLVKLVRGESVTPLGTIKIGAVTMTKALGGVVFYVTDDGLHGLVVHPECVVPAETIWGPSIPMDPYYANTEDGIYKGASNTEKLVAQWKKVVEDGTYDGTKSPAVVCDELEAGGYNDWFLPSKAELFELFDVKAALAEKALFAIPANNYWSSVEFTEEAPSWDWAMWYVNFYEATDHVTWCADKLAWKIGAIAMRMF